MPERRSGFIVNYGTQTVLFLSRNVIVEGFLLFVVSIWALNFSVVKYSLNEIDPLSFNAFRFIFAIAFIWIIVVVRGIKIRIDRKDWAKLAGLALLGNLIYQLLFIFGLDLTFSANAAVMLGTIPVWTALFSHVFFEEKLTRIRGFGVFFAFAGVALIMGGGADGFDIGTSTFTGDLIIILAAMVFATYTLFSKSFLYKYTPIELSTVVMTVGGIGLILVALPDLLSLDYSEVSWAAYGGALYSGVFAIGVAYLVWNYGIRQVGAVRTSTFQNLVPVLGVILGFFLLGETLTLIQYSGAGSVILGIVLARWR